MACEKEMASCVRGYHIYNNIWAAAIEEVLFCFTVKLYSCKIFSYVFCVQKYFYNKKKRITVAPRILMLLGTEMYLQCSTVCTSVVFILK